MSGNRTCDQCGKTAWPQMSLNAKGTIVPACPSCGVEHRDVALQNFQTAKPVDADKKPLPPVPFTPSPSALPPPPPVATVGYVPPGPGTAVHAPPPVPRVERFDVIGAVRERLAFLEAEDARLEGIVADARARLVGARVEAKKLRRMLQAADRASVLPVYSPTGDPIHQ